MDAITTARLQQYGGGRSPLLLAPPPSLSGLFPGSAVQTYNPQPNLPQAGAPALPQQHARNTAADSMLNQIRDSTASAARQAEQEQQQANSAGSGGMGALGGAMGGGMNTPYLLRQLGLGYSGTSALTPFQNPSVTGINPSQFQMPKIF